MEDQFDYKELRKIVSERTSPVVLWIGAGLSKSANLPLWADLKKYVGKNIREKLENIEDQGSVKSKLAALKEADSSEDYWSSFEIYKRISSQTFRSSVRSVMGQSDTCVLPDIYKKIWELPLRGIINLNIDRLAARGFAATHGGGKKLDEFTSLEVKNRLTALRGKNPFIFNVHGILENYRSWVFTRSELNTLRKNPGYVRFLQSTIATSVIIFLGVTVDDFAVSGHLKEFKENNLDLGFHYWITHRDDSRSFDLAESLGIRTIVYNSVNNHERLEKCVEGLCNYVSLDKPENPLIDISVEQAIALPTNNELASKKPEEIRRVLNQEATKILKMKDSESYEKFQSLCQEYERSIYNAWYTSCHPPENQFFEYQLIREIAEGGFGIVYEAKNKNGEKVAIKKLKDDVRRKSDMLRSFRRGARSMKILKNKNIDGVVRYIQATEIPASIIMEFVNGPNLDEVIKNDYVNSWPDIIKIAHELSNTILKAHQLPERVLHRDVRPPNIILQDYYENNGDDWNLIVLDFDLSWHMGAIEDSVGLSSVSGFIAPEQISRHYLKDGTSISSRNALVDSYGIGMTIYYMCSRVEPIFNQPANKSWRSDLLEFIDSKECTQWKSLPCRVRRLIYESTQTSQERRLDVSQIIGELEELRTALSGKYQNISTELWAEELAANLAFHYNLDYHWSSEDLTARISLSGGVSIIIIPDPGKKKIELHVSWNKTDNHEHKKIRKYLHRNFKNSKRILESEKWCINHYNVDSFNAVIKASLGVLHLHTYFSSVLKSMKECLKQLRF